MHASLQASNLLCHVLAEPFHVNGSSETQIYRKYAQLIFSLRSFGGWWLLDGISVRLLTVKLNHHVLLYSFGGCLMERLFGFLHR